MSTLTMISEGAAMDWNIEMMERRVLVNFIVKAYVECVCDEGGLVRSVE